MSAGVFDGIWAYGREMYAYDADSADGRKFRGFIEPLSSGYEILESRKRAGIVFQEKYRLIAEASETFPCGTGTEIVCDSVKYELLSVKKFYDCGTVSHRECILLKTGEADGSA